MMQTYCKMIVIRRENCGCDHAVECGRVLTSDGVCDNAAKHAAEEGAISVSEDAEGDGK